MLTGGNNSKFNKTSALLEGQLIILTPHYNCYIYSLSVNNFIL